MSNYQDEEQFAFQNEPAIDWYNRAVSNGNASWKEQEDACEREYNEELFELAFGKLKSLYDNDFNNGFLALKLGDFYNTGKGCKKDSDKANSLYKKAFDLYKAEADKKNLAQAYAMAKIGDFFRDGKGVPPSETKARCWYTKALVLDTYFQYKLDNLNGIVERDTVNSSYDALKDLARSL